MEVTCAQCNKRYTRPPARIGKFCSRECGHEARRKPRTQCRRMLRAPDHPLAGKTGYVSNARAVLFEHIGWGPHPCHWCSREVNWFMGVRGNNHDALVADHFDSDPLNDAPENLVAACGPCNGTRGRRIRDDEVFVVRGTRRLRATKRSCEHCGKSFLSVLSQVASGKGRFCSRSCARKHPYASNSRS